MRKGFERAKWEKQVFVRMRLDKKEVKERKGRGRGKGGKKEVFLRGPYSLMAFGFH